MLISMCYNISYVEHYYCAIYLMQKFLRCKKYCARYHMFFKLKIVQIHQIMCKFNASLKLKY